MPSVKSEPSGLRPYLQHGLTLSYQSNEDAIGDCFSCEKEEKLYINQETGQYSCKSCGASGNHYTFLRELFAASKELSEELLQEISEERNIDSSILTRWGLRESSLDGSLILPSYNLKKEINNIYRWTPMKKGDTWKKRLLVTSEVPHAIFGLQFWEPKKKDVFILEGPWDAMKLEEELCKWRNVEGELVESKNRGKSLYNNYNLVALPGCDQFKDSWIDIFRGMNVIICFDNDYPKKVKDKIIEPAGFRGLKKVASYLVDSVSNIRVLVWGEEGYTRDLKDGYDVRDFLSKA